MVADGGFHIGARRGGHVPPAGGTGPAWDGRAEALARLLVDGDGRIRPDAATGLNRYGCRAAPLEVGGGGLPVVLAFCAAAPLTAPGFRRVRLAPRDRDGAAAAGRPSRGRCCCRAGGGASDAVGGGAGGGGAGPGAARGVPTAGVLLRWEAALATAEPAFAGRRLGAALEADLQEAGGPVLSTAQVGGRIALRACVCNHCTRAGSVVEAAAARGGASAGAFPSRRSVPW